LLRRLASAARAGLPGRHRRSMTPSSAPCGGKSVMRLAHWLAARVAPQVAAGALVEVLLPLLASAAGVDTVGRGGVEVGEGLGPLFREEVAEGCEERGAVQTVLRAREREVQTGSRAEGRRRRLSGR
jgi:hypothetical protein